MSSDPNWVKVPEFAADRWFNPRHDGRLEGFLRARGLVPDPEAGNEPRWVHVVEVDEGTLVAVREYARLTPRLLSIGIGSRIGLAALDRLQHRQGGPGAWQWTIEVQKSPFSPPKVVPMPPAVEEPAEREPGLDDDYEPPF
jgi:hypothetical protein